MSQNKDTGRLESAYRPEFAQRAYEILAAGKTQAQMAKAFDVRERTIQRWKQEFLMNGQSNPFYHDEFAVMYEKGMAANKAWWDEQAQDQIANPQEHFDSTLYVIERKRRHGAADSRTLNLQNLAKAQTYAEQASAIKDDLAAGEITPDEANKIANALEKLARVSDLESILSEITELKKFKDEYQKNAQKT